MVSFMYKRLVCFLAEEKENFRQTKFLKNVSETDFGENFEDGFEILNCLKILKVLTLEFWNFGTNL